MRKIPTTMVIAVLLAAAPAFAGWDEGVAAFKKGDFQTAYQQFQEYVQGNPEAYQGQYMLGLASNKLGRKEEALKHLRKAYDLNPNDLSIKMALGSAYSANGRNSDVAKLFGSIDASSLPAAQQAFFYQTRGTARMKAGDDGGALKDFAELARLKPNDAKIQYSYGSTALASGQMDTGIAALRKATQLASSNEDYHRAYVQALVLKGRRTKDKGGKKQVYGQAATAARALVGVKSSYDNILLQASAELGAGQYDAAAGNARAALAKNSNDWLAHFYLGQALTSSGGYSAAVEPLNKAKSLASGSDRNLVLKQLGFAFEKQKKWTEAVAAYVEAGDQGGVARVEANQQTAEFNAQVEQENAQIKAMEEEARRLEEELKELEGGGLR